MLEVIDVQVLMQEIRDRISQGQPGLPLSSALPMAEIECLKRVSKALHLRKTLVGRLPPEPPTLRGRVGGLMVKAVRRGLSWYTSRLDDFHSDVIETFDLQLSALNSLSSVTRQNVEAVALLKRKLADVSAELAPNPAPGEAREESDERDLTPAAATESGDGLQELEARFRRLEMAFLQLHAELSSQGYSNLETPESRRLILDNSGVRARHDQP